MRNISLRQFRYFLAVAESGSVASASRLLNIAQSAVTKSILELEDALGVKLFARTTKGMSLTQDGHRFQASARKVLSAVAEASQLDRGLPKSLSGRFAIGVTSLVAGYYLAPLFSRFQRSHPSVEIQVIEDTPQFLEHLLINGELDACLMVSNSLSDPQALVVETLTQSQNRVWIAANHPLCEKQELTIEECARYPQISLEADRIEMAMRSIWSRYGVHPHTLLRTSSLEAVRSLVGVGAGIAVLPSFLYRPWTLENDHIEVRNLREAIPTVDVGLVWRRGMTLPPVVSEFIDTAREQSASGRMR
jgi:DNA-binding transcriptional LysR family regulator